jgi:hypothetical protein
METWAETVRARGMALAREGAIPAGYRLQQRRGRRMITDMTAAFARSGLNPEAFLEACSISLPKLVEQVAAARCIPKAEAQRDLDQRFADLIEKAEPITALVKA